MFAIGIKGFEKLISYNKWEVFVFLIRTFITLIEKIEMKNFETEAKTCRNFISLFMIALSAQ